MPPEFHRPSVPETIKINISSDHSFLCNATTTYGAVLFWETVPVQQGGARVTVFEPEEAIKLDGALNETTLRGLCRGRSSDRFAVSLGQRDVIEEEIEALVWVQQTALVICNAHTNFSASYSCKASDSDHGSNFLVLDVTLPSPEPQGDTISIWVAALVVVFSLIALAAVTGIACMILRFRLQNKPPPYTLGIPNPIVIDDDFRRDSPELKEFPRERLELKEVLGRVFFLFVSCFVFVFVFGGGGG